MKKIREATEDIKYERYAKAIFMVFGVFSFIAGEAIIYGSNITILGQIMITVMSIISAICFFGLFLFKVTEDLERRYNDDEKD